MDKNYLILPGCDDKNRGDQALIWETVEIARKAGYIGQYYILASEENSQQSKKIGIKNFLPILDHPSRKNSNQDNLKYSILLKLRWGLTSIMDILSCEPLAHKGFRRLLNRFIKKERKHSLELFKNADACFVKGGGFLHAYGGLADTYKIYYFLYHIRLALSFGKDVYIMPNSFGPFNSPFVKRMMNKTLSKCKVVMSRENISQKQLYEQCNVKSYLFTDIAFHIPKDDTFNAKENLISKGVPLGEKKCVGITMRPYRFTGLENPNNLYENYKDSLVGFIQWLNEKNYYPILIEHVYDKKSHENDMSCIQEVVNKIPNNCDFSVYSNRQLNCMQMKKVYSELDYLVGTRFHSVIFSIASFVPAIAITYGGNKGKGIMNDLELNDYAIPIDRINYDLLVQKFESMLLNEEQIRKTIKTSVTKIKDQVDEIVDLIK